MNNEAARKLSRQLALGAIIRNIVPVLVLLFFVALCVLPTTNMPVSQRVIEGRYVRWTRFSEGDGAPTNAYMFVDLSDGRTVAVIVGGSWLPPEAGSIVRIEEQSLRWYGKHYSLAP